MDRAQEIKCFCAVPKLSVKRRKIADCFNGGDAQKENKPSLVGDGLLAVTKLSGKRCFLNSGNATLYVIFVFP